MKPTNQFKGNLLNHPAYKANGVDPLWRWIAAMGWITVAVLVATIAARGQEQLRGGEWRVERKNFCAVPVLAEARGGTTYRPDGANGTPAAAQFISGSKAVATNGSLGSGFSSGSTKQRTTPEPAGPGLLKVAGDRLKVTGSRAANVAPNLQPATSHLHLSEQTSLITERFLDALEEVESGRDARAVGDHGRSLGSYQFKAVAWEQVNTLRKSQGLVRHSYRFNAQNRVTARIYARMYLRWLETYLTRALRRSPTCHELYAAWNLGPTGFRARGFDLRKCPPHVRKAADRLSGGELRVESRAGGGK